MRIFCKVDIEYFFCNLLSAGIHKSWLVSVKQKFNLKL